MSADPSLDGPGHLATQLWQARSVSDTPFIVVEGPDDVRLLDRVVGRRWQAFSANSRDRVLEEVEACVGLNVTRIAGIADADFDDFRERARTSFAPVFTYEYADLEALLVALGFLCAALAELDRKGHLDLFGGVKAVVEKSTIAAQIVGRLRTANAREGWGIDLKAIALNTARLIEYPSISIRREALVNAALSTTTEPISFRDVDAILGDENVHENDPYSGKDVTKIAHGVYKHKNSHAERNWETLAQAMRLAAESSLLESPPFPEVTETVERTE